MTTYHVVQGWVDDDGKHDVGDTITLGDEGLDNMKVGYLLHQGYISTDEPPKAKEDELVVGIGNQMKTDVPKKRAHRAHKATKKS